ncbi:group 3 secretory phospholipase A2 [Pempheris klunzingeri]|uniref:group 3 secretory phospholipase A2 n=1 Tax=Pempheris klunzingeri TaxID=3127111 RepID=UPI0039813DE2
MAHIAALLSLILTSSPLTWTLPEEASTFCTWTKVLPSGEVRSTFLRRASPSLRLYQGAWSGQRALLGCAWSDDAAVIRNYLSVCQERTDEFTDRPDELIDMLDAEELCVSPGEERSVRKHQGQAERSEVRAHQRVKRGFIVPGTLWCGAGNKAPSYEDLGVFADTDSCCRQHDQCKHTILSFHSEFGVFNSNIFTMSHCDCDNKFHHCLMKANDSISDVVGYTFFNLLKMHCFVFSHRLQCAQRNWFGMCKETKMDVYAEVHPPTMYESTTPAEVSLNSTSSTVNTTTSAERPESSTPDRRLSSVTAAAPTGPTPSTNASDAPVTNGTTNTSRGPAGPGAGNTDRQENTLPNTKNLDAALTEEQLSCAVYKELDMCRKKILPKQRRYGLYNPEVTTLYHCNCTARLFQTLAKQRQLTEVQALLLGHVSQSCFLPQDCTAGTICAAALVKAELPQVDRRSGSDMEERRHLQAVRLEVRRPSARRARRKDRSIRLHKLCLRIAKNTRRHGQDAARRRELI